VSIDEETLSSVPAVDTVIREENSKKVASIIFGSFIGKISFHGDNLRYRLISVKEVQSLVVYSSSIIPF